MDWLKIGYAVLCIALLIWITPTAIQWMKNGPKAEKGDWQAFILPMIIVVAFVAGLMMMVSR